MKKYYLVPLQNLSMIITALYDVPLGGWEKSIGGQIEKDAAISPEQVLKFLQAIETHEKHVKYFGLKQSLKYIDLIKGKLNTTTYTCRQYENDIAILQDREDHELQDYVFGFIPAEKAGYYQNKELFGNQVHIRFPSAATDIEEAGNCYAHGTYTACVFHLMRALEHPLRALAIKLGVTPPAKHPRTPIELRTWGDVIDKIVTAINARPNPKTRRQAELAEFYNKAADQFQFFKDAWRDVVMHTRNKPYGEGETKDLIRSVETFMQRLAVQLKERA